jgi:hypothetical protein
MNHKSSAGNDDQSDWKKGLQQRKLRFDTKGDSKKRQKLVEDAHALLAGYFKEEQYIGRSADDIPASSKKNVLLDIALEMVEKGETLLDEKAFRESTSYGSYYKTALNSLLKDGTLVRVALGKIKYLTFSKEMHQITRAVEGPVA